MEKQWENANRDNIPYLEYNVTDVAGKPLPPPQRQFAEPPIQAIALSRQQSAEDIKATMGMYDASIGNRSNEVSGRAIVARQKEGDTVTFNFPDNLSRSIRHLGRILVDLIPKVYDVGRIERIIGSDEREKRVDIKNDPQAPAVEPMMDPEGREEIGKVFNIGVGKYDVTIEAGPSYMTKRQQAVDSILRLVEAWPQAMPVLGDILAKSLDIPFAAEIGERLKAILPPEVRAVADEDGPDIPPQVQQQLAQLQQQLQMLQQQNQALMQEKQAKSQELQSKERIEAAKLGPKWAELEMELNEKMGQVDTMRDEISQIRDILEKQSMGQTVQ